MSKKILVLGAGHVAKPCVSYLVKKGYKLIVADNNQNQLDCIKNCAPNIDTVYFDASLGVENLIGKEKPEVVISLLPPSFMADVMSSCIKNASHMIHPAYLNEEQKKLSDDARKAGIVIIAEIGLDPGIDHMSAAKNIDFAKKSGLITESFISVCGALPALEANNNPWGYKLSWDPASLIGASRRSARVKIDGEVKEWLDGETYEHIQLKEIDGLGWFEVYANADSISYIDIYDIPEVKTIYRGTLRYVGWCETISAMNEIGLLSEKAEDTKHLTYNAFVAKKLGVDEKDSREALKKRLRIKENSAVMQRLSWLGFFNDDPIGLDKANGQQIVSNLFNKKLTFGPKERDLIVLSDEFIFKNLETGKRTKIVSELVDYGEPGGDSAIARTTGLPPAIAAHLILEGEIHTPGINIPILNEIYTPVLRELRNEGVLLFEKELTV